MVEVMVLGSVKIYYMAYMSITIYTEQLYGA